MFKATLSFLEPLPSSALEKGQSLRSVLNDVPGHIVKYGAVALPFSSILARLPAFWNGRPFVSLSMEDRGSLRHNGTRITGLEGVLADSSFLLERKSVNLLIDEASVVNGVFDHLTQVSVGAAMASGASLEDTGYFLFFCVCVFF